MMKKISVITISYNAKDTIEKTLCSVISQTKFKNIEYIVIDGNSTDGTQKIIEKYRDKIAYYISEPDNGIYNAMNKGILAATGDYVHFLNANDIYSDEEVIEKILEQAESCDTDFIIGDVTLLTTQGAKIPRSSKNISRLTLFIDWIYHVTLFQKRELFQKYGLFDESFKISADANWFIPLLQDKKITKSYVKKTIAEFSLDGISAQKDSRDETFAELEKVLSKNFVGTDDLYRKILCSYEFNKYAPTHIKILKLFLKATKLKEKFIKLLKRRKSWQIKYENMVK